MDKEQAPSRNEGCRTFLLLLLVLARVRLDRVLVTLGETCSLRKAKSTWLGTLPLSPPRRRIVWGKVVRVSRPGSAARPETWRRISECTRQLAQASPGSGPLLTSPSTDRVPPGSHKLPGPDLGLVDGTRPGQLALPPCEACQSVPRAAVSSELASILTSVAWSNPNISPHSTLPQRQH